MLDAYITQLRSCTPLTEQDVYEICDMAKGVLIQQSNLLHIPMPISVVGDVHGQFYDVLELFRIGGEPPDTSYLFLGDYVDRGAFSVETISLLLCMMLRWPERVHLLRGNHESRDISLGYGFYEECLKKYGGLYGSVRLPCYWGYYSLDQIRVLDRFIELPLEGPMADLLWSDPDETKNGFTMNPRNVGYTFGCDVVAKFLHVNGIGEIVRAHQMCNDGYKIQLDGTVITVWSAPNYCYRCGNDASILEISEMGDMFVNVFTEAPIHERVIPDDDEKEIPDYFL